MAFGFGILDYVVVIAVAICTTYLLIRTPAKLLTLLPLFLTIDFFIPLGTQLTPSRFVPVLIGVWLVSQRRYSMVPQFRLWTGAASVTLILALLYSLYLGDAGVRPYLRLANYLGLLCIFLYVLTTVRSVSDIEKGLMGLAIAASIHAIYSVYQVLAFRYHLPYRGIVYDDSGFGGVGLAGAAGLLRVNGLADEPKRLGYVLLCGGLAISYFVWTHYYPDYFSNPQIEPNFKYLGIQWSDAT